MSSSLVISIYIHIDIHIHVDSVYSMVIERCRDDSNSLEIGTQPAVLSVNVSLNGTHELCIKSLILQPSVYDVSVIQPTGYHCIEL